MEPYIRTMEMPWAAARSATDSGDGRAAEAHEVHELQVLVGAVGVVEQAGQEVGGP